MESCLQLRTGSRLEACRIAPSGVSFKSVRTLEEQGDMEHRPSKRCVTAPSGTQATLAYAQRDSQNVGIADGLAA